MKIFQVNKKNYISRYRSCNQTMSFVSKFLIWKSLCKSYYYPNLLCILCNHKMILLV